MLKGAGANLIPRLGYVYGHTKGVDMYWQKMVEMWMFVFSDIQEIIDWKDHFKVIYGSEKGMHYDIFIISWLNLCSFQENNRLKVPVGSRLYKLEAEEVAI